MNMHADIIKTNKNFLSSLSAPKREDILCLSAAFGISRVDAIYLYDSTRNADDIRLNYILDKRYVLRICNAPDMTEKRMQSLVRLIE